MAELAAGTIGRVGHELSRCFDFAGAAGPLAARGSGARYP